MSFMEGNLRTKTKKLVKGLAKAEPLWLKAMEQAPPATFPRAEGKVKPISLSEDFYIQKFYKKISRFDSLPARIFGLRVLDLKEQAGSAKKKQWLLPIKAAYRRLKQIAKLQGKKPPPNPYPEYIHDHFHNLEIHEIVKKMKKENAAWMQDQTRGFGGW
ncbi:hypothetical protein M9H77_18542 [Catharanthus roseus]|uniref:Uncharacterized protein n=1 Tax=Catharanthus roseus TaxID=4058 RepID=A0ACC0B7R0_CATRO|nr:hypothetical protein M9H77_18542 [Catharanthus roseus]